MTNTRTINTPLVTLMAIAILALAALTFAYTSSLARAQTGTEPVISAVAATSTDMGATVTWNTDQDSNSQVAYGTTSGSENAMTTLTDTGTGVMSHTAFLGGLTPNTTYFYEVVSSNGSTTATSSEASFMTTNTGNGDITASSTAPMISNVAVVPTTTGATITWNTDQSSNSQVAYGSTSSYGTMTALADTSGVTSHTVMLSGLTASTMYHFAVMSGNGETTATSTDMTFTTNAASTTASTTPSAMTNTATNISSSDATLNGTNGPVAAQGESFWVSTSPISTASPTIPSGVFSTPILSGVAANTMFSDPLSLVTTSGMPSNMTAIQPNTTYYFVAWSEVNGTWYPGQEMTLTTTATSTDTSFLQNEITTLQQEVATLQSQIAGLLGGNTGTTTSGNTGSASIDQNNSTISAGSSVDFSGRNFDREENVTVMLNGNTVATAHADGGGNFSTGSIAGPATAGTYTYTFLGSDGDSASATINVQ